MEKILPINLSIPHFFRGWESVRLPAILAQEKNYAWFIDKYNTIVMDTDFNVSYCFWDSLERLRIYDDILDYTRLKASNPKELLDTTIEMIDNNQYVIAVLDPSQMECSPHYGQNKGYIDVLVFGYNTDERSLYLIDIEIKDLSQGYVKVSYKDYTQGYFSSYATVKSHPYDMEDGAISFLIQNGPLAAYTVRNVMFEPKLPNFYWQLKKNLYGGEFTVTPMDDYVHHRKSIYYKQIDKRRMGVTVYKTYYETLAQMVTSEGTHVLDYPLVTWGVRSLSLIKSLLTDELVYLNDKGFVQVEPILINANRELCNKLFSCFMMLTRYKKTNNLKYFYEFCETMKAIEEMDIQFLADLCRNLYQQINTYYFPDVENKIP
jgi:hypothetical protein